MKKSGLLFLAVTFNLAFINAQITITSSDMPNPGDSIRVSTSVSIISTSVTGANAVWDYSSLTPVIQSVTPIIPPSAFSVPYNILFNGFNTSYGIKQYTPDSIAGFQPDNAYNYFKESNSDYKKIGMGISINSIPVPAMFSQADYIYRFPLNYGNTDSSDAHFEVTIPGFGTYSQSIHRVNVVDSWGQLTTPLGTVPALRVKSTVLTRDSIAPSDTSIGNYAFNRPLTYEYKWLTTGCKIPYLEIDATDFGTGETVTNIIYQDIYHPETPQLGMENNTGITYYNVYPNPSSGSCILQFYCQQPGDAILSVADLHGKIVYIKKLHIGNPGSQNHTIDLTGFASGMYTYSISLGAQSYNGKLIVQ